MQYNVATLLKEHTGASRQYDIDDDVRIEGESHRIAGRVRLDRTNDGILVRARLAGEASLECSRCLKPVAFAVDIVIEEEYIPTFDLNTGARIDAPEGEEDAYRIGPRNMLDLAEPVAQYWSLALPMAPVCREDCPGLCPECGGERAAPDHACAADPTDARWSRLSDLKL